MNTNTEAAFNEAFEGQHVAHVCGTCRGEERVVAIRPNPNGTYTLDFSATSLEVRETMHNIQSGNARHLVEMFIHGVSVVVDLSRNYFEGMDLFINQAWRDVGVQLDTLTPTRVRIDYELPNTGVAEAWRHQAIIGDYMFIGIMYRGNCELNGGF